MDTTELCYTPATALARAIRHKELSPVELVEGVLTRIEAVNPRINAYCTVAADQAREAARSDERQVMQGEALGPLHGLPVSLKDLTPTAGIRSTSAVRDRLKKSRPALFDGLRVSRKTARAITSATADSPLASAPTPHGCRSKRARPK